MKTKIFTDDQVSIGSSEGLSLYLPEIAPWHLLIEKKHDVFSVLDLNSEMGTIVNGHKITEETLLESGSIIKIGPYEIQFFIGPPVSAKTSQPAPPPLKEPAKPSPPPPLKEEPAEAKTPLKAEPVEAKSSAPLKPPSPPPELPPQPVETVDLQKPLDKPLKKGFWNTYAPPSKIKNLDDFITPSIGNLIEVNLAWKERILKTYHFSKSQDVHIGSDKKCEIYFPNMLNNPSYKLLTISGGAKIYISGSVKGVLFQGKKTRTSHALNNNQSLVLKPYEMVKLNFNSFLTVYVRLTNKPARPAMVGLLNLRLSESLALLFAFLLTGLLFFYGTLYAPAFLTKDIDFIEKDVRVAQVVFEKLPPKKTETKKVVKYDLNKPAKKTSRVSRLRKDIKKLTKRPAIKTTKKTPKKTAAPKTGKPGKIRAVAPGKKKNTKVKVGSARPGGSLKTGKQGSSAKTAAPDPTKVGLLGVFGGGGKLTQLDKGASGPGGLTGLATEYTGYGGTDEAYEGEGIGTKTKDLSSGGKGSSIIGISGIKTTGKGLGYAGTGTGSLGERGRLSMEFSTEDIDVSGEIDKEGILRVLTSNRSKFDRCYQVALNADSSIQGKLAMKWRISSSGRGRNALALTGIKNNRLRNCVANVLDSLNFPPPPSGQIPEVRFSFNFTL